MSRRNSPGRIGETRGEEELIRGDQYKFFC